jgi:hypothetical protein
MEESRPDYWQALAYVRHAGPQMSCGGVSLGQEHSDGCWRGLQIRGHRGRSDPSERAQQT